MIILGSTAHPPDAHGQPIVNDDMETLNSKIALSEARTDTKFAQLTGRIDLLLATERRAEMGIARAIGGQEPGAITPRQRAKLTQRSRGTLVRITQNREQAMAAAYAHHDPNPDPAPFGTAPSGTAPPGTEEKAS